MNLKVVFKKTHHELKTFLSEWKKAKVNIYGCATAYGVIFSLAPILIITLSVSGFLFNRVTIENGIIHNFSLTFGEKGEVFATGLISNAHVLAHNGVIAGIFGAILILIGASAVFSTLRSALDEIFESLPEKKYKGIWKTILQRLISLGIVLSLGFILIVSLALSAIIKVISNTIHYIYVSPTFITTTTEVTISFVVISLFLGLMLKFLPSHRLKWRPALMGGVIAGTFFTLGKYALGQYLGSSSAATAYGAASSLILIILWTYYMSLAFFASAIVTKLYFLKRR